MKDRAEGMRSTWIPAGVGINYVCLACGGELPSITVNRSSCQCGNVKVELGGVYLVQVRWFRVSVVAKHVAASRRAWTS